MSLETKSVDGDGSDEALVEAADKFDDAPVGGSFRQRPSRLLGLLRQFSESKLNAAAPQNDDDLSPSRTSRNSTPRTGSHSRQLSVCSSRRSLQDEQSRRLSAISRQRTDDLLSEIVEEEFKIKRTFAGKRSSCRDRQRNVEEVLYNDAATIRNNLEQLRIRTWTASEQQAMMAGTTDDSKLILLRKTKSRIKDYFEEFVSNRNGKINKGSLRMLLEKLGIFQQERPGHDSKSKKLFSRFWSVLAREPNCNGEGITFIAFYRYTIIIMFPILLRLLTDEHEISAFEKQILDEAKTVSLEQKSKNNENVFADGLDAGFMSGLARCLIENANLIRLMQPIRHQLQSSDDEFEFHPEITPRSERLAHRRRHFSGGRRFTEELQQQAREAQRRRDADEAKKYETELEGCTFRPIVNGKQPRSHRYYESRSRFEQLYEIGVHQVEDRRRHRSRSESPVPYRPFHMKSIPTAVINNRPMPRGFQETVERSRRAFRKRLQEKEQREQLGQQFVERYDRRERRAMRKATGSRNDEIISHRIHDRYAEWYKTQLQPRRRPAPLLYIDINIGHGRTGRISIYPNTDPGVQSKNFARIFDLDRDTEERLTVMLEQHCRRVQNEYQEAGLAATQVENGDNG